MALCDIRRPMIPSRYRFSDEVDLAVPSDSKSKLGGNGLVRYQKTNVTVEMQVLG